MAKNIIQFQKGLSLPKFLEKYGTEVPRRFKWNSSKNLCQYSAKYWHEEKTWTATRYCYWDWGFSLPGN